MSSYKSDEITHKKDGGSRDIISAYKASSLALLCSDQGSQ